MAVSIEEISAEVERPETPATPATPAASPEDRSPPAERRRECALLAQLERRAARLRAD